MKLVPSGAGAGLSHCLRLCCLSEPTFRLSLPRSPPDCPQRGSPRGLCPVGSDLCPGAHSCLQRSLCSYFCPAKHRAGLQPSPAHLWPARLFKPVSAAGHLPPDCAPELSRNPPSSGFFCESFGPSGRYLPSELFCSTLSAGALGRDRSCGLPTAHPSVYRLPAIPPFLHRGNLSRTAPLRRFSFDLDPVGRGPDRRTLL